jgi:hypothetical protein
MGLANAALNVVAENVVAENVSLLDAWRFVRGDMKGLMGDSCHGSAVRIANEDV